MFSVRPPALASILFRSLIWRIPTREKKIYLTFDDGPIPEVTPWVLDTLKKHQARATFFCIGDNVKKNPAVYSDILQQGHTTGNHTYNHVNGWETRETAYFDNIHQCSKLVSSSLFRPPYGKITRSQILALKKKYSIIMWDVLSQDYDKTISPEKCLKNVTRYTREGSIVVFHDSLKAEDNLRYALPRMLEYFSGKGFSFERLK